MKGIRLGLIVVVALILPIVANAQSQGGGKATPDTRFGRVKKAMAPEYREFESSFEKHRSFESASYYAQVLIHRAHVVMLTEQNILSREEGASILKGLKEVEKFAEVNDSLKPYIATEGALIKLIGSVGGKMHIGRSRNDLGLTQGRVYYRDQMNILIGVLIEYQKSLIEKAKENLNTVMPGYTHRKQAQPVTFAHYLLSHVEAAGRSLERLEDAYRRTNLNPLGAAALAGTGWPIKRGRTTELLGFDGLVINTQDGVASWDFISELASAIVLHMSNLARLAGDIQVWQSDEFAILDLDEAYAGTSTIMPQKKNPIPLELVKLSANQCLGAFVAIMASLNGMEYSFSLEREHLQPYTLDLAANGTKVMGGLVYTVRPQKEQMLTLATKGFSTMTDLADFLVKSSNLSFREAHDIIARTVLRAVAEGKTGDQITADMIQQSAVETQGKKLDIPDKEIQLATDPSENVKRRSVVGGPSPKAVQEMINYFEDQIKRQEMRHQARIGKVRNALIQLGESEGKIIDSVVKR